MRYDDETIDRVKDANDIVGIISERVKLTKRGSNYFGLCPFHGENTPSFCVSPDKQIYHCFGCGESGNIYRFLMNYENESFTEALKYLAGRAGIVLPEPKEDTRYRSRRALKESLIKIHTDAAIYYNGILKTGKGAAGLNYLMKERGLDHRIITRFGLGHTGTSGDGLYKHLKSKGYTDDIIGQSGLVIYKETDIRDRFLNRVMFPIMDIQSHVIGFGGRVMGDQIPKYLNSPESPIFNKSDTLYALNFAKKSRRKGIIVTEGYLDTISLFKAGFDNAVATLGTALTDRHARLLRRYTDTVYLAYDSDEAGTKAKLRAFPVLYNAGLNVRAVRMKGAKDPDEFLKRYGAAAYEELLNNAENAFLYNVSEIKNNYNLGDPAEKTSFYREAARMLTIFKEPLERQNYTESVAREHFIPLNELKNMVELDMLGIGGTASTGGDTRPITRDLLSQGNTEGEARSLKDEELIARWLCERPDLAGAVLRYISPDEFSSPLIAGIINEISSKGSIDPSSYMNKYVDDDAASGILGRIFTSDTESEGLSAKSRSEVQKGFSEAVKSVRTARLNEMIKLAGEDIQKVNTYRKEINNLTGLKVNLDEESFSET